MEPLERSALSSHFCLKVFNQFFHFFPFNVQGWTNVCPGVDKMSMLLIIINNYIVILLSKSQTKLSYIFYNDSFQIFLDGIWCIDLPDEIIVFV